MRFIEKPSVELLYKETRIVLHVDNRYRGDILKQIKKVDGLDKEYTLELKKKRSDKEAPAQQYIWLMINKIAEKQKREPIALYKEYIVKHTNHHTVYYDSMTEAMRCKEEWEERGIGYMFLNMIDYKEYVKVERTRGYSGWNRNETDRFVSMLERECNSLGVNNATTRVDKDT